MSPEVTKGQPESFNLNFIIIPTNKRAIAERYIKIPISEPVFRATKGNGVRRRIVMLIKSSISISF
ncbi:hypothetical protein YN1HA_18500 [Sulfurisphaera ohwakuensis]